MVPLPQLTFACDFCGACCRTWMVLVSVDDARREPRVAVEGRELPPHLGGADWRYQLYPLPFQDRCCFLDHECRCEIYETRPAVCRRFEAGSERCQEARAAQGLPPLAPAATADCPP